MVVAAALQNAANRAVEGGHQPGAGRHAAAARRGHLPGVAPTSDSSPGGRRREAFADEIHAPRGRIQTMRKHLRSADGIPGGAATAGFAGVPGPCARMCSEFLRVQQCVKEEYDQPEADDQAR